MQRLKGDHIYLRALEEEDLEFLYRLENDSDIWEISGTVTPYSRHVLRQYLENAHKDIYEVKQFRFCICSKVGEPIGLIDLFDFDPKNQRVGLGIVILEDRNRNLGAGSAALSLVCDYAFGDLGLRQVYANVLEDNTRSIHVFQKLGFERVGTKKDWIKGRNGYKNEILFQKINR